MFKFFSEVDQTVRYTIGHILVFIGVTLTSIAAGFINTAAWIMDLDIRDQ